ncbi:MAG TPA: hypothetical protein VNA69_10730 [Thermoanaerobaculia bacterium]|nr:hypothetical protein [Thermoanaerobaculia bacterium]
MSDSQSDHPDLETQSAFVEGTLDLGKSAAVIRHLSRCARCRLVVGRVAEIEEELEEEKAAPRRWVPQRRRPSRERRRVHLPVQKAAIAIFIALAILAVVWIVVDSTRPPGADPIVRMASAAPISIRTIKPRLSGGYGWAPLRNVMADAPDPSAEELRAASVAGQVLQELQNNTSARALHGKGVAYLIRDNAAAAVPLLRQAARLSPDDARIWNDLAAALYVFAASDLELREALAAAKHAVRFDPGLTEAYFNVALILERGIGTKEQIKAAWSEYLRRDPSGGWSDEAKERLALYQQNQ